MWKTIQCVRVHYLIFLAWCLFAFGSTLTFLKTWANGHKGQCYFHGSICWQKAACVAAMKLRSFWGKRCARASSGVQRGVGSRVHFVTLLGSEYLVKILLGLACHFLLLKGTVTVRLSFTFLANASHPLLFTLIVHWLSLLAPT